ncbi:YqgE/AlgH family protein [Luminiphilus sp. nBUS_07]|uniref:YqgE/AlgH family protein n=1 Tax=Luminiphilus sp. nBUS_07 TaxID=3395314 RepID=UPI003EBE6380
MSQMPKHFHSLKDHFLMATPALSSGFFAKSLTYICEHNPDGAMGIVINQPSNIPFAKIFEQLDLNTSHCTPDQIALAGGPVQVEHGFLLHDQEGQWESTVQTGSHTWLTTSKDILVAIANGHDTGQTLLALGYAGWSAGQLEDELAANAWLTVEADAEILFETPYEKRLHAAGLRLGIDIHLMSNMAGHS